MQLEPCALQLPHSMMGTRSDFGNATPKLPALSHSSYDLISPLRLPPSSTPGTIKRQDFHSEVPHVAPSPRGTVPLRSESAPVCQVGAPTISESHAMMSSPDTSPMSTCKQTAHSCLQQSEALRNPHALYTARSAAGDRIQAGRLSDVPRGRLGVARGSGVVPAIAQ